MIGTIAQQEIEAKKELLTSLAKKIWENPEIGYKEFKASQWSAEVLEQEGFAVETQYAGVPTAIRAVWGSGKPVIGFLGEYDALSNMSQGVSTQRQAIVPGGPGHGCGHSLMTPACIGAALGLKKEMETRGLSGTLVVYGCPAEEMLTGKAFMARGGAFRELDIAFSWHPLAKTSMMSLGSIANALNSAKFHFKGLTAHAGADPQNGRSALDAVQLMNMGVEFLREHVTDDVRIHYAFCDVPASPNVVPDKASVWYYVRALSRDGVEDAYRRIVRAAEGAAWMTETEVEIEFMGGCYETLPNKTLYQLIDQASKEIPGVSWTQEELDFAKALNETSANYQSFLDSGLIDGHMQFDAFELDMDTTVKSNGGSNDVGEVQHIIPAIAFGTPSSNIGAAAALKAIEDPQIIEAAKAEFAQQTHNRPYVCPIPDEVPIP